MTTGPATKHQKGKPGKGSPRLEKIKKKVKVEGEDENGGGDFEVGQFCSVSGFGAAVASVGEGKLKAKENLNSSTFPSPRPPEVPAIRGILNR